MSGTPDDQEARLLGHALRYLGRFSATRERLRQVLLRRARRELPPGSESEHELAARVAGVVQRCVELGLVDDASYARARACRLLRRGTSPARAIAHLRARGVPPDLAAQAVAAPGGAGEDPAFVAACAYARRRRLGPFRPPAEREAMRTRDLAALARAGFTYDVASRVVGADSPDELDRS